ncbi:MAG: rRNA maturation RNase YbeY [Pseudomonadota bacterium]
MTETTPRLIEVLLEDVRWSEPGLETLAETAARLTLRHLGFGTDGFLIGCLGCDDARIASLNADFRGRSAPTNILAWPSRERRAEHVGGHPAAPGAGLTDDPEELGDLAISYETCAAEAHAQGKTLSDHATHLLVHGILHLLGYDHVDDQDATVMEKLEIDILARAGVANPYAPQAERRL